MGGSKSKAKPAQGKICLKLYFHLKNLDKRLPNSLLPNIFTVPNQKESTTPIIETAEATCEDYNFNTRGK